MRPSSLRKASGVAIVLLLACATARVRGGNNLQAECSAGKPYCYDTPVHLDSPINTPGFEGKPSLSADGLELYFVSDRPGALGGPGDDLPVGELPRALGDQLLFVAEFEVHLHQLRLDLKSRSATLDRARR